MQRILIYIALFLPILGFSQNLVPNPSFEKYTDCPTGSSQWNLAVDWDRPINQTGTPDYMNACMEGNQSVPANFYGFQEALSGTAYQGIITWYEFTEVREYLQAKLTEPLQNGEAYLVGFYISHSDEFKYACDGIGIYLSDEKVDGREGFPALTEYTPQVNNASGNVISNSNDWVKIEQIYYANGGEQFITLGNFLGNDEVTINDLGEGQSWAYYYVDSVYVFPLKMASAEPFKESMECLLAYAMEESEAIISEENNIDIFRIEEIIIDQKMSPSNKSISGFAFR